MAISDGKFAWFVRLGYLARGLVYALLGALALMTAGKAQDGQAAVFDLLQDVPWGETILVAVAIGLAAYALFKASDAVLNVERHGDDVKGGAKRVGAAASALAHLALAYTAVQFAIGRETQAEGGSGDSQERAATLLNWEMGPWLLGAVGIGFLVAALMQARSAYTAHFMKRIGGDAPALVEPVGRVGHAARALVFGVIGWSLMKAGWWSDSDQVKGLGEALVALSNHGWVYSMVAIGLIAFGLFSLVTAWYRVIPDVTSHVARAAR